MHDRLTDFDRTSDRGRIDVMASRTERSSQLIAERVDVKFAVDILGTAVERNEVGIDLRNLLDLGKPNQLPNAGAPRQPDHLIIAEDSSDEREPRACHILFDGLEVVTLRNDKRLLETETLFEGGFQVFIVLLLDRYLDDPAIDRSFEIFADGRAFNVEARGDKKLMETKRDELLAIIRG